MHTAEELEIEGKGACVGRSFTLHRFRSDQAGSDAPMASVGMAALVSIYEGECSPTAQKKQCETRLSFVIGSSQALTWLEESIKGLPPSSWTIIKERGNDFVRTVYLDVVTPPQDKLPATPTREECLNEVERLRLSGNEKLTAEGSAYRAWYAAASDYARALDWLNRAGGDVDIAVRIRLNLALCHIRLKNWSMCIQQCDAVLAMKKDCAKAYYRRAVGYAEVDCYQRALADFKVARQLCPEDKAILRDIQRVANKSYATIMKAREEFAQTYQKRVIGPIFNKPVIE